MNMLAVLLLAPWFAVLGWVYWKTAPSGFAAGRGFDVVMLVAALAMAMLGMALGLRYDPAGHHPIIREVAAALIAYKGFLLVLGAAWLWRWRAVRASTPLSG